MLLRNVSDRLKNSVRKVDTVTRMGGDEFAIYLDGIKSTEQTPAVMGKITELIQAPLELRPALLIRIDSPIGWACYPDDGNDAETLLKDADALYSRTKYRIIDDSCRAPPPALRRHGAVTGGEPRPTLKNIRTAFASNQVFHLSLCLLKD